MPVNKSVKQKIEEEAGAAYPMAVRVRRKIHANPELSGNERNTARLAYGFLKDIGCSPAYYVRRTGVAAMMKNGPGPTVVLRADMDALPVEEKTSASFASRKKGVMHACGHDMHTAALLGAAHVLAKLKQMWRGTVVFLFQPSEEKEPGGAREMIAEGAFPKKVDSVFGLHVSAQHTTGQVGLKAGEECSGELVFDVTVKGKGGHGSAPHSTVDPIVCAASMIMDLQTLISRECPAVEPAVLTVGSLHAGTKNNVIPDEAVFHGTIRTFSPALQKLLRRRVAQSLRTAARSFRAGVDITFRDSYPPGYNDPQLAARMQSTFALMLGKRNVVIHAHPTMFSEDFTYFQQKAPGLYVHLGVKPQGVRKMAGIHSAAFLPDEKALLTAMMLHAGFVLDRIGTAGE
jgi:amidohydrolase